MTFLVSVFVTRETLCLGCFFYQGEFRACVTERCTSLSKRFEMFRQNLLEVAVKKLNLQEPFATHELLQK